MKITSLLGLAKEMPDYRWLIEELKQSDVSVGISLLNAAKPYIIAAVYKELGLPVLIITAQPHNSRDLQEQITVWADAQTSLFPEPCNLPYQRAITDKTTMMERIRILSLLTGAIKGDKPPLVVVSAPAFISKVAEYSHFIAASDKVKLGMDVEPLSLLNRWQRSGYELGNVVEAPGSMSRRGGILDIYPPTSELPARLEFFGNIIDSIRLFDPISQRSLKPVSEIDIGPATEMLAVPFGDRVELERIINDIDCRGCNNSKKRQFYQELDMLLEGRLPVGDEFYAQLLSSGHILDYLPERSLVILDEPPNVQETVEYLNTEARRLLDNRLKNGDLPHNLPLPYFTWQELESRLNNRRHLSLDSWLDDGNDMRRLNFKQHINYTSQLPKLLETIKQLSREGKRIILISHQASRLSELLVEKDVIAVPVSKVEEIPLPSSLTLVQGILNQGWVMHDATYLYTDNEIFGFIKQKRLLPKQPATHIGSIVDIKPGDFVVHLEHGIARFAGVVTMGDDGIEREYLLLQYAAGDRLYVPVDQIDRINRYVAAGDRQPTLNRLGTQEWTRSKQKARESAEGVARELLALYAARQVVDGFAFSPDTIWQRELEASFPYMETPDQIVVQEQVKEDMMQSKPMDRLVCGDVGYGKTEVAIRAAFKAVMDYKQVAFLVPTTVLAQQHISTFRQRLGAFPIRIEMLNRFRSAAEQRQIIDGLASGNVDICIGTHRLLQKDVVFKDMGLLIIDEEQRFGVGHKEHFKKMRQQVDVLTLSATPIPRTLHMSLVGVRDMSIMETPPAERLPVKTYVTQYDNRLVREAILRELERNGQVFFVHNRVRSIVHMAEKLKTLVPEASIAVAHGRMAEGELERIMADFTGGDIDVLVCTTIIESGLDIPNANTLIVDQADRLGLTQLYQLRGRVGRGTNMAYAYFPYHKDKRLTEDARKRLRTIFEASELGAGFGIAIKDLEIRGAGNLLGMRQSGHITAVGFNLYTRLLGEAVEEEKVRQTGNSANQIKCLPIPTITLPLPTYISEDYVSDVDTRLKLYHRLAEVDNEEQIEVLRYDFKDRFGDIPQEVENLLYAISIKLLAAKAGIESISTEESSIILRPFSGMRFNKKKLQLVLRDGVEFGLIQLKLDYKKLNSQWKRVIEDTLRVLGDGEV
ncbi:MAG: transcription-repair coupling factor [Dehalococcoidia bacterium]|nr:MAG: transcription-repair coupling factor [Dehalococcoidia bacterium]